MTSNRVYGWLSLLLACTGTASIVIGTLWIGAKLVGQVHHDDHAPPPQYSNGQWATMRMDGSVVQVLGWKRWDERAMNHCYLARLRGELGEVYERELRTARDPSEKVSK